MTPGRYDRLCEVQGPDHQRGSSGGVTRRWVTLFSFWAEKAEAGSRQFLAAGVTNVEATAVFTTHHNPEIKARQRFLCEGTTWEIVGPPRELGRRDETMIEAKTIPA
jgi:SPP1 family predicted phage head-tail adaptor